MYVSPNHPNRDRLTAPTQEPTENGRRLATFERGIEEFRVVLSEYKGFPFVSLRVFAPGPNGTMLPVKGKGCTIRMKEVEELAKVLAEIANTCPKSSRDARTEAPRREPSPTGRQNWGKAGLPPGNDGPGEFDEFAE